MDKFLITIVTAGVIVFTLIGDYFLKVSSQSENLFFSKNAFLGIFFYGITAFGWIYLMKKWDLTTVAIVYASINVVALAAMGHFIFKETISPKQAIGILMAIGAIVLVEK